MIRRIFGLIAVSALLTGVYACQGNSNADSSILAEESDQGISTSRDFNIGDEVDCSQAYGEPTTCEITVCDKNYKTFIGTWKGPFLSYVQELSTEDIPVFRPYANTVTYSESDCLKNAGSSETFIIGRRTDKYPEFQSLPAKENSGMLITGRKQDGAPFLRTIDDEGNNSYTLVYKNQPANLSIWKLKIPASDDNPEMRFTTIDGQDWNDAAVHKRNVTVTMSLGPEDSPFWEQVIVKGYHSLRK